MTEKQCKNPDCARVLPLSEFGVDTRTKDGRTLICKDCIKKIGKRKLQKPRNVRVPGAVLKICKNCRKYIDVLPTATTCKCDHCGTSFNISPTLGNTKDDNKNGFRLWKPSQMGNDNRTVDVINYIKLHSRCYVAEIARKLDYPIQSIRKDVYKLGEQGKVRLFKQSNFIYIEWVETVSVEVTA